MEVTLNNSFSNLTNNDLNNINGSSITLATIIFVALGYKITVGDCLATGATIGLVAGVVVFVVATVQAAYNFLIR